MKERIADHIGTPNPFLPLMPPFLLFFFLANCESENEIERKSKDYHGLNKEAKRFLINAPDRITLLNKGSQKSYSYRKDLDHSKVPRDNAKDLVRGELRYRNTDGKDKDLILALQSSPDASASIELTHGDTYRMTHRWDDAAIGDIEIDGKDYEDVRYLSGSRIGVWFSMERGILKIEKTQQDSIYEREGI